MKKSKLLATGAVAALMFSPMVAFAAGNGQGQDGGHGQGLNVQSGHGLGLGHSDKVKGNFHMNAKASAKAGGSKLNAQSSADNNTSANTQNTSGNSGQTKTHGNSGNGMKHKAAAQAKHTQHMQAVADLHKAIDQLHADQKIDRAEHQKLVQQMQAYIAQVEQAISIGNTSGLNKAVSQAQQIMSALKQAEQAQVSEVQNATSGATFQKDGHLANAIQSIDRADARVKQKTQAMQTAVGQLQTVTSNLKASNQAYAQQNASGSTSGSSNTTGNMTGNTTGNTTGNMTGNTTGNMTGNTIGNSTGGNTVTANVVNSTQSSTPTQGDDNEIEQSDQQNTNTTADDSENVTSNSTNTTSSGSENTSNDTAFQMFWVHLFKSIFG